MRINWLQPWFEHRWTSATPTRTAVTKRWPFLGRHQPAPGGTPTPTSSTRAGRRPIPTQRVAVSLPHHLDVALATQYLVHALNCDTWHVVCHHGHQMVVHLTQSGIARYCVAYDCSPPVEKAVCHGSRAWAMAITPLHGEDNIPEQKLMEIKAGLGRLHA